MEEASGKQKIHHKRQAGAKVKRKGNKSKGNNPKAFAVQHANKAARSVRRALDLEEKKHHIPVADRTNVELPPVVVAVVGPRGVGKSTLITCLVKKLSGQRIREIRGPITVVANKKRRLTFLEVSTDIHSMVDAAKVADLVLLLVDAQFGKIEMETFEFTQIVKVHPGQKVIGVLNHLDGLKDKKSLKKLKKRLKKRFWDEVYAGAKLFYMTHFIRDEYVKREIENLTRFISIMKYRPVDWRQTHSYLLVDRVEDVTPVEKVKENPQIGRTVSLYGYVRGAHLYAGTNAHIPGVGDFNLDDINFLDDPCPSPTAKKRRTLMDKEKKLYAPMSGVGDLLMDRDAVYMQVRDNRKTTRDPQLKAIVRPQADSYTDDEESDEEMDVSDSEESEDMSMDEKSDDDSKHDEGESEEEEEDVSNMEDDNSDDDEFDGEDIVNSNWKKKGRRDLRSSLNKVNDVESMKGAFEELAQKWRPVDVGRINWNQYVYGKNKKSKVEQEEEENDVLFGNLLRLSHDENDREDTTLLQTTMNDLVLDEASRNDLANRFVTGTWDESEDAHALLEADDVNRRKLMDDESDANSEEIEDDSGSDDEIEEDDDPAAKIIVKDRDRKTLKAQKREKYLEKKKRQREVFEAAYEAAKSIYDKDGGRDHYTKWREEVENRARVSREQFANLDDDLRVQLEGYRAGMYVRLEIKEVPHQFMDNFNPRSPIIVGSLLASEEVLGYIRCNFKLHRWYGRILKSGDPVLLSIGWRRYQSVVNYSIQDHNGRHRFVKYTPKHQHCNAIFYGPQCPKGTGVLAYPSSRTPNDKFRICGTGGIEENDQLIDLKKKLKLCGTPYKIFKKTAFIKGMFNSGLEASKLVGAKIQTVSGIRGVIKKVLSEANGIPPGTVRASFEDKIRASDIIFCRLWASVEVPSYYNIVSNLLLPPDSTGQRDGWQGLRTTGQLRYDLGLKAPNREDSHYSEIRRREFVETPLHVPAKLQSRLPYKDKPRNQSSSEVVDKVTAARPPQVREPHEERRTELVNMLKAVSEMSAKRRREKNLKRTRLHKRMTAEIEQRKEVMRKRAEKRKMAVKGARAKNKK